VFEVKVDGALVFSKKKLGRFPEHSEIFTEIDARKA
jgi:selT/selW/selH-like putative selenoprotein